MRPLTPTVLLLAMRLGAQNATLVDSTRPPAAPSAPTVTAAWNAERPVPRDATLALTLSRPLRPDDGRLVVVVGPADLSALLETTGTRVRLPLRGERLPAGLHEVRAYLAPRDERGAWTELGRFPLKLLGRAGLEAFALRPKLDVQSDGQLDARLPPEQAASARPGTYQDLTLNGGVEGTLRRAGTELGVQALLVGASRDEARLRAAQLGPHAPPLDLASYDLRLTRGPVTAHAGHLAVGGARHLANQFRSRGLSLDLSRGRVQLGLAGVSGSELVGWGDPLGIGRPSHRVLTGSLGVEAVPNRPGLMRLDLAALGGSLQPRPGFLQASVTDREQSRGGSAQLAAADPSGHVRLAAGFTRSRFANPRDPTLGADSVALVAVRPETRDARFGELRVEALRGDTLLGLATTLSLAARHERVDPQFRSVAATTQADRTQDALELTAAVGALQIQAAVDRARDNLDRVPSLMTTRTRTRSLNGALPIARLVRAADAHAWWWPTLTGAWQSLRQAGDAAPPDGGFRFASQVPDQRTRNATLSAGWQRATGTLTLRAERSAIDNRQPERETSDVTTDVLGATLGYTPSARLTLGLDLARNLVRDAAAGRRARDRRVALQGEWRPLGHTSLGGTLGLAASDDPSSSRRGRNTDVRVELSQGFDVYARREGASQVRAFVRYARSGAALRLEDGIQPTVRQWAVAGGLSARLF